MYHLKTRTWKSYSGAIGPIAGIYPRKRFHDWKGADEIIQRAQKVCLANKTPVLLQTDFKKISKSLSNNDDVWLDKKYLVGMVSKRPKSRFEQVWDIKCVGVSWLTMSQFNKLYKVANIDNGCVLHGHRR